MLSSPYHMLSDGSESYGINMSIVSIQLDKEDLDFITSEPDEQYVHQHTQRSYSCSNRESIKITSRRIDGQPCDC